MATIGIVTADWLAAHGEESDVAVLDTRSQADYWDGHVPGARHLEASLLGLPRTDPAALARFHAVLGWSLSALGLTSDTHVVVTGAPNDVNAARAAWALAYAGVARISLLLGGLSQWQGERSSGAPAVRATRFDVRPRKEWLATADEVLEATGTGRPVLDAREWEDYTGERSNAARKGHVPGARFWDTRKELDQDGNPASAASLDSALADVGAAGASPIVYCGGGGRAARSFVALQLAGRTDVAVYPASWNEWGNLERYPVATGPQS